MNPDFLVWVCSASFRHSNIFSPWKIPSIIPYRRSFCGAYISQMKNLDVFCEFSFANGPVPTIILDKRSMYLTKHWQLNFRECRLICEFRKNEVPRQLAPYMVVHHSLEWCSSQPKQDHSQKKNKGVSKSPDRGHMVYNKRFEFKNLVGRL